MRKLRLTLLAADDQRLVDAAQSARGRSRAFEVVVEAVEASQVKSLVRRRQPGMVLLDLRAPAAGALACLSDLTRVDREINVILLSLTSDSKSLDLAFKRDASAYIVDFAELGEQANLEAVEPATAQAAAADSSSSATANAAALTPRELEILTALAQGHSNAAIADKLFISPRTVKFHLTNLYRKIEVSSRTEAALYAHRRGLVPPVA